MENKVIIKTLTNYTKYNILSVIKEVNMLIIPVILFIAGCLLSSFEDTSYNAQKREEQRHKELMKALSSHNDEPKERRTRRRVLKDVKGNIIAEEVIEEML
jgi:hypothetical protein